LGAALGSLATDVDRATVEHALLEDAARPESIAECAASWCRFDRFAGQILEWYLNTADYGSRRGIDAAALTYFGNMPASSLADAALLAGIAPSVHQPHRSAGRG
jgi:hypothetical protein